MEQRQAILQQIKSLQVKLVQLDSINPPSSSSSSSVRPAGTGKRSKKAAIGPLPASLAAAPKRHIALLFAYDGWAHSGLAYQPNLSSSPLPTVEGCILSALEQARLIEPMIEGDGFGCGFERCGRTDAGVSSSAQVINLWVRSALEDPMGTKALQDEGDVMEGVEQEQEQEREEVVVQANGASLDALEAAAVPTTNAVASTSKALPASHVEIPYLAVINRFLPSTIRILAWSPVSPSFSSRFSCIWRHYKYFFSTSPTNPFLRPRFDYGSAYSSGARTPGGGEAEWDEWQRNLSKIDFGGLELDVELMRDAVQRLVGDHDFRNLCKVDPPKQLPTHRRTVISATIDPIEGEGPDMFVLNLRGGAFLYNQVRHIVALLFLVGARLERPSIIDDLLWTSERSETTESMQSSRPSTPVPREIMDTKPGYEMADDLPLVLWQCGYNGAALNWRMDNSPQSGNLVPAAPSAEDVETLRHAHVQEKKPLDPVETFRRNFLELHEIWTQQRLKSIILKHHVTALASHAPSPPPPPPVLPPPTGPPPPTPKGTRPAKEVMTLTPHGAGRFCKTTKYIPLLQRRRGELPREANRKWAEGRGKEKMAVRAGNKARSDAERAVNLEKKAEARRLQEEEQRSREE